MNTENTKGPLWKLVLLFVPGLIVAVMGAVAIVGIELMDRIPQPSDDRVQRTIIRTVEVIGFPIGFSLVMLTAFVIIASNKMVNFCEPN
jgi:hypothetical protein